MESTAIATRPPKTPIVPEADATGSTAPPPGTSIEGSVLLVIDGKPFVLRGTFSGGINVAYHRSLDKAAVIGTIDTIAGTIAGALGLDAKEIQGKVKAAIGSLNRVNGLGDHLEKMEIVLTDLVINTKAGIYEFGIGASFAKDPFKFQEFSLNGVGVKITYVKPAASATTKTV
jgi:hypothetical protein